MPGSKNPSLAFDEHGVIVIHLAAITDENC